AGARGRWRPGGPWGGRTRRGGAAIGHRPSRGSSRPGGGRTHAIAGRAEEVFARASSNQPAPPYRGQARARYVVADRAFTARDIDHSVAPDEPFRNGGRNRGRGADVDAARLRGTPYVRSGRR